MNISPRDAHEEPTGVPGNTVVFYPSCMRCRLILLWLASMSAAEERRRVRWGIMGTGTIANDFVRVLRAVPDAEVAAIGSRTTDRASLFANEHDVAGATIYGTYEELAADETIDIVYIATPSARHVSGAPCSQQAARLPKA